MLIEYEHEKFLDTEDVIALKWGYLDDYVTGTRSHVLHILRRSGPDIDIVHDIWRDAFSLEKKIKSAISSK